jgi:L-cysteine S-thiosulfotransferase
MIAAGHRAPRTTALRNATAVALLWVAAAGTARADVAPSDVRIIGDGVPEPVAAAPGDATRGRAFVVARDNANCVLCHAVPDPAVRFSGNVGPSLAGVGGRLTAAQLRLRVADNLRVNPESVMPSYYRVAGLDRVAPPYAGKPILSAAEVEDLVAYLSTLR